MAALTPLAVPVPDNLEALLGYDGEAEWVAFYFDMQAGEAMWDDGRGPAIAAYDAYQLYTEHPVVAPHLRGYELGGVAKPARHHLVLNRSTRTLVVASARAARAHVRARWPEPPRPPAKEEIGTILAQWTWRLRGEQTQAGQAALAAARAARPRTLAALRAWLDDQVQNADHTCAGLTAVQGAHEAKDERTGGEPAMISTHENPAAPPTSRASIDWDAPITLQEAAAISGLAYDSVRKLAHTGRLRSVKVGARLHTTTRRWLDDYLRARGTPGGRGKPPKALPADYQAPPRRGRPPRVRPELGEQ